MKKTAFVTSFLLLGLFAFSQQSFIPESLVINIEVPVRVFDGNRFVENLTIKDFQLFENDIEQNIEAVYLIKKNAIERSEEKRRFLPATGRKYYLIFQVTEYSPRLQEAVSYFADNVLQEGDTLYVGTPMKSYKLREKALELRTGSEIAGELKSLLRKDIMTGNAEYRAALNDMTNLAKDLSRLMPISANADQAILQADPDSGASGVEELDSETLTFDEKIINYASLVNKMEILRSVDQIKLMDFARHLKSQEGQKLVFLFYQKEYIPQIDPKVVGLFLSAYDQSPYVEETLARVQEFYRRPVPFDLEKVKQTYSDATASIHFLFLTEPPRPTPGVYFQENSEDLYKAFRQMALATGGTFFRSYNAASAFQSALDASENYYLLYYTPKNYRATGEFKRISVRLKSGDHDIIHRAGYISN
jgi:hypothetical protein